MENDSEKLIKDAEERLVCLMMNEPYEFIKAMQRMMGQAAYDVFMIMERYRAAVHDSNVPGNVIIQVPVRPEDTEMTLRLGVFMGIIAEALGGAGQQTDDYDAILKIAKKEEGGNDG